MGKLIKSLSIGIDLRSLTEKNINETTESLARYNSWKGSLGAVTVFHEIFDLYLLIPQTKLTYEEIQKWLVTAQVDKCFRKFIDIDEKIRDSLLAQSISVTITSDRSLAENLKESERVYFLKRYQSVNIDTQIQKVNQWREIVRDLSFFSSQAE